MRYGWLFMLACLAACSPQEQILAPAITVPAISDNHFITSDGVELPMRSWLPKGKPKAVIGALHGFNDYSNSFVATGEYLKKQGIATFAYDQRGFGESLQRGIWAGEANLTRDAGDFVRAMSARYPHTPIFLLGESMGGAVAMLASQQKDLPELSGIILVSPAVWGGDTMSPLYQFMMWTAAHTVPEQTLTGRDLKIIASNNIPMLRRLSKDEHVIKATRIDAIYGISNLMDSAYTNAEHVGTPVLLMYGGEDQIIPVTPVISVVKRLPKPFTVAYYEDGYHMLTRDIQRDLVLSDMAGWIKENGHNRP